MAMKFLIAMTLIVVVSVIAKEGLAKRENDLLTHTISVQEANYLKLFIQDICSNSTVIDDIYEEALEAASILYTCRGQFIPEGENETLYNHECKLIIHSFNCMKNFIAFFKPYLDEKGRNRQLIFTRMTTNFLDFWCQNDAEKYALFHAQGASQCFETKKSGLDTCTNSTFPAFLNGNQSTIEFLRDFIVHLENCDNLQRFKDCVIGEFETCNDPSHTKFLESMFKSIIKDTPCSHTDVQQL